MKIQVSYNGAAFPHPYHAHWTNVHGEGEHVQARTFDELLATVHGMTGLAFHFALETE